MKTLIFQHHGNEYQVNERGEIKANGLPDHSAQWIFLGGTKHHWSNRITVPFELAMRKPELLNGCLGFDRDHGTLRQWGGRYCGKLPRITRAHVIAHLAS